MNKNNYLLLLLLCFANIVVAEKFRVMVVYTENTLINTYDNNFNNLSKDIQDFVIDDVNLAYEESGINARVELACIVETDFTKTTSISQDLENFAGGFDGVMDNIHGIRRETGIQADICILLVEQKDAYPARKEGYVITGRAVSIGGTSVSGDSVTTGLSSDFLIAASGYWLRNQLIAHELGHLFGCRHGHDTSRNVLVRNNINQYIYGFGFPREEEPDNGTIMTYAKTKKGFFSGPDVKESGSDASWGDHTESNCVRVHNEQIGRIAGLSRTEDTVVWDSPITINARYVNAVATNRIIIKPGFSLRSGTKLRASISQ